MNCIKKIHRTKLLFIGFLSSIIAIGFNGIVGNTAYAMLLRILDFAKTIVTWNNTWQIIVVLLLPCCIICSILLGLTALRYYRSQQAALNLVRLDDTLLRLLSSFKANPDKKAATRLLFQEFLADTLELFEDGCRISIMRPDNNDSEWLVIWQSLRVPPETIQRTRLYIGSTQAHPKEGIAGKVFSTQKRIVVHLSWNKKELIWSPDNKNYVPFISRITEKSLPYRAIASVPIIDSNDDALGVLCLDSMDPRAFDSQEIQDGLSSVSERISAILKILENYN